MLVQIKSTPNIFYNNVNKFFLLILKKIEVNVMRVYVLGKIFTIMNNIHNNTRVRSKWMLLIKKMTITRLRER